MNKFAHTDRPVRRVARAEAVGSLLRPRAITDLLGSIYDGMTTSLRSSILSQRPLLLQRLNTLADAEIRRLVQRQIDAGLDVVTDGELRRTSFLNSFYDAVEGLSAAPARYGTRDEHGQVTYSTLADPVICAGLRKTASPLAEESTFLRSITDFPFKVTLPAPSYFYTHFITTPKGYESRQQLVNDVVTIERTLVAEAIAAGANWIQFDFPLYPALVDGAYADRILKELGLTTGAALFERALEADREVTQAIPDEVTVAMHLCRGNVEGGFWNGSIAPIAERMFSALPHDRFLVEWEDIAREGNYEPIKYVPKGRIIALGLISTKTTRVERPEEIIARLENAARYVDIGQLALCTQCGFASTCGDHLAQSEEVQWSKLKVIGEVADHVWPRDEE